MMNERLKGKFDRLGRKDGWGGEKNGNLLTVKRVKTLLFIQPGQKNTKFDKTMRREICRITTPGTKTPNILDNEFASTTHNYLFSVIEKVL
jgi:hypothetical protein